MMDEIDVAQAKEADLREAAIAAARGVRLPVAHSVHCEDCGVEISEARRRLVPGCARCAECQAEMEGKR